MPLRGIVAVNDMRLSEIILTTKSQYRTDNEDSSIMQSNQVIKHIYEHYVRLVDFR